MSVYQRVEDKIVVYYGNKTSETYRKLGLIWNRDRYFGWTMIEQTG